MSDLSCPLFRDTQFRSGMGVFCSPGDGCLFAGGALALLIENVPLGESTFCFPELSALGLL